LRAHKNRRRGQWALTTSSPMSLLRYLTQLFRRKDSGATTRCDEKFSSSRSSTDSELSVYVNLPKPFLAPTKGDRPLPTCPGQSVSPYAIYDGGFPDAQRRGICIRIANGGAGQAGLVKAWADAFVKDRVARGSQPFQVISIYLGKD
jgi:hypothetical protein